jgi:hypothetical protein
MTDVIGTISVWAYWAVIIVAFGILASLIIFAEIWIGALLEALTRRPVFFDQIPEPYATGYVKAGKFFALALSQENFGAVNAPSNLNWGVRQIGDAEPWPAWTDKEGVPHPAEESHFYKAQDFHWDRRPLFVRKIFGEKTGIVWMGLPPLVKPKTYHLRITNFRTVRPTEEEVKKQNGTVEEYKIDGEVIGYLVAINENTSRVLLADDVYVIRVEGVRIGTKLSKEQGEQQAVQAKTLLFLRARIREPYLFLYRGEDVFELIQNEALQHVREIFATSTIEQIFSLPVTLRSDQIRNNEILNKNDFAWYMGDRYGFEIKGAGFGPIQITGEAGVALTAPFIAEQNARAEAIRGRGEGEAESKRLTLEGAAFQTVIDEIGPESAALLRHADVAGQFATSGKASTVVLGMDFLKTAAAGLVGNIKPSGIPRKEEPKGDHQPEPQQSQPKQ